MTSSGGAGNPRQPRARPHGAIALSGFPAAAAIRRRALAISRSRALVECASATGGWASTSISPRQYCERWRRAQAYRVSGSSPQRDHIGTAIRPRAIFSRKTIAPLIVEADQMQDVLACIDANGVSDCSGCLMGT